MTNSTYHAKNAKGAKGLRRLAAIREFPSTNGGCSIRPQGSQVAELFAPFAFFA
jgi:hypothetical protein